MAASGSELAVRNYLLFLDDPSKLVEPHRVADLEREITARSDPIERLRLFGMLEELLHPIEAPYRKAFVAHAKEWAEGNGVSAPAFLRMGVPEDVLQAAGLSTAASSGSRLSGGHDALGGVERRSRRVVRAREVVDAILLQPGLFSLQTIEAESGASPMTVRKALKELIGTGAARRLGPDPAWAKAGRAPVLYDLVRE